MTNRIILKARNVAIGFFVLVFIMVFFSKSIINLFLPKVLTEAAVDGTVERSLNVAGTLEAKKSYKIRLSGAVIVEEYLVKEGELVTVGQPLFRIDKNYGIKGEEFPLQSMQLQLESKELSLSNLKDVNYEIEEKSLNAMESKLSKSREELAKQQELYDAGVIAKQELEGYEDAIGQQQLDIELFRLQLQEKKKQDAAAIRELENDIKNDRLQMAELQKKQDTYSGVDGEGIFHSTQAGTVLRLGEVQSVLPGETELLVLADNSGLDSLTFIADIPETEYEFAKSAGEIQIGENVLDSVYLKISAIYPQGDLCRIEAPVSKDEMEKALLGQKLKGIIKQRIVLKGHNKVPKAALVTFENYKEGSSGTVYLLEESEGVLGKEFRAKATAVKILAAGDDAVIVSGLESIEEPEVIVNLSYKIQDGEKVFLWQ